MLLHACRAFVFSTAPYFPTQKTKKQKKRQAQSRGCWNVPPLKRLFGTTFFCVYGKSAVNKLYNIKVFEVTFMEYLFYHFFFFLKS